MSGPGASRFAGSEAPSLDTEKQLATSVANWLKDQETPLDKYQNRVRLWRRLCATVYSIWQDHANRPKDGLDKIWWDNYEKERLRLKTDTNPEYDAWLGKYVKKHGLPQCSEAYLHCLYMTEWKKKNRPSGRCAAILAWEKQYFQLMHCQGEWIGYKGCCAGTKSVAVPIGCNHRLCPLCSWHRAEMAQRKTKILFDRLTHPQVITLTTPNLKKISKRTFQVFRGKVKQFLAQHKEMFAGGIYALETTYNRTEKTWHVHAHLLVDGTFKLPSKDQRIDFAGRNMPAFTIV